MENDIVKKAGFYPVPGLPQVKVNEDGVVINARTENVYSGINSQGYRAITLNDKTVNVHRLVAETFIPKPAIYSGKLYVNHKNGIRSDNRTCNLEWVTPKENAIHAYASGLRNDNKPVLTKNIRTGEVEKFYSLQACARKFNVNAAVIHNHLKRQKRDKLIFKEFLLIEEGQEWPVFHEDEVAEDSGCIEVLVFDKDKGLYILFDSVSSAAVEFKIKAVTLSKKLRVAKASGKKCCIGNLTFEYYKQSDYRGEAIKRSATRNLGNRTSPRKPLKIEVVDLKTNQKNIWDSSEQFAEHLGVSKNTLQKHISLNEGVWKNAFKINYVPFQKPN